LAQQDLPLLEMADTVPADEKHDADTRQIGLSIDG